MTKKKLPQNVKDFLDKCCSIVGKYEEERHGFESYSSAMSINESPIEQLFGAAIHTLAKTNGYEQGEKIISRKSFVRYGVQIWQQKEIGRYRVDFELSYCDEAALFLVKEGKIICGQEEKRIIVELDGHEFHDRNEKQRRHEKARDRFFQKQGYKVFRYTGAEIVQNPFTAAAECLAYLTGESEEDLLDPIITHGGGNDE